MKNKKRFIIMTAALLGAIGIIGIGVTLFRKLPIGKSYYQKAAARAASVEDYTKKEYEKQKQFLEENLVDDSFYHSLQDFAFRSASGLFQARQSEQGKEELEEDFLYSPLSLYYALAVVAEGAAGETQKELLELLEVSSADELTEEAGKLYRCLYRENKDSAFQIANSLWMAKERNGKAINWNPVFLKTASKDFYASLFSVDFRDAATGKAMGEWVSDQTKGLLKPEFQTMPHIQENGNVYEQLLGILNTIYLKDSWGSEFHTTEREPFYLADGDEKEFPFMKKTTDGTFYRGTDYGRASLWLKNLGRMVFVLPEEGVSVEELISSPERLKEAFTGGEEVFAEISWQVPKFSCQIEQDLKKGLQKLGVQSAFDEEKADFSNMAEWQEQQGQEGKPFVSEVRQGTRLAIDEEGIEAAAYTYVEMGATTAAMKPEEKEKIEMNLNRPFLYGIVYEDTYVFIGICSNPTETK